MTYIYPRKMIIHYKIIIIKIIIIIIIIIIIYNVHYPILVIGDLITHQLPLLDTFFIQNQYHICGAYLYPLMLSWYGLNNYYIKNTKKIYGISLENLLAFTNGIFLLLGIKYHFFGKLIKNK
jgi:hypothetical protein